jgi:hypothetical protein
VFERNARGVKRTIGESSENLVSSADKLQHPAYDGRQRRDLHHVNRCCRQNDPNTLDGETCKTLNPSGATSFCVASGSWTSIHVSCCVRVSRLWSAQVKCTSVALGMASPRA